MGRFCTFFMMTVFGSIGWWIGNKYGFTTGIVVSGIGNVVGIYVGWYVYNEYLS
jgi:hypothetical protein